jgi:membrane AbrB-like protein
MRLPALRIDRLRQLAETLTIAAFGGTLAQRLGVPVGFLSGSMLFVAAAAIAGRPMYVPNPLARALYVVMGMSIGSVVTPQTVAGISAWPVSIATLAVAMLAIMAITASYLHFAHGFDPLSALFAASPGALSQVMVLSLETGSDLRAVAVVQTMRIFILTLGLPGALALLGFDGSRLVMPAGPPVAQAIPELAVLIFASAVVAFLFQRLRIPGGLIFGAMLPSAILHGAGLVQVRLPLWAVSTLMVAIGAIAGSRFAGTDTRVLLRLFAAAFGSFAVAIGVTMLCAFGVAWLLALPTADLVLAYAPGSVDAMMLLALALGLDPVFVGAHHLARIVLVSLCQPFFVRLYGGRKGDGGPTTDDG